VDVLLVLIYSKLHLKSFACLLIQTDLFTNVTLFRIFHSNKKKKPHRSMYHAKVCKYVKFHKNPLLSLGNMGPQIFTKNVCHGATKLANCMKLRIFTKFGIYEGDFLFV